MLFSSACTSGLAEYESDDRTGPNGSFYLRLDFTEDELIKKIYALPIEHGGAWQGFTCDISRYPDDSLTAVVLTNLDAGHSSPEIIAHVVAGLVEPALMPAKLTAIADNDPATATAVRKLLDELVAGTDIRAQVTPDLAAVITPDAAKRLQQFLAPVWPGGTLTLVQREAAPGAPGVTASTFRVSKGSDALLIRYGRNAAGKIAVLGFSPDRPWE